MVKDLRRKFVLFTTTLMVVVFFIIFSSYVIYHYYWNRLEKLNFLEWVIDSEVFEDNFDVASDNIIEEFSEEDNPIVGIEVDKNGNIVSRRVIGEGKSTKVNSDMIKKIIKSRPDDYTIGFYVYAHKTLENGNELYVIMDSIYREDVMARIIYGAIITISAILVIIGITFYLSKFFTIPAEEAIKREKQFITDVSHELKTPLGAISINAEALTKTSDNELQINNILSETKRMNRLIERLLTLSKLEERQLMDQRVFSLSDVIEEMVLTYESLAYEKQVSYKYSIESGIRINGSEDEIKQLIAILIDNAIKNAGENGYINISLSSNKSGRLIKISNSGKGINKDELEHIFERFYTLDASRNNNSFGLGLAIAKAIVERHKGQIYVTSDIDQETIFTILL